MATKRACVAVDNWPRKVEFFREAFQNEVWITFEEGPGLTAEMFNFYVTVHEMDVERLAMLCRKLNLKARAEKN